MRPCQRQAGSSVSETSLQFPAKAGCIVNPSTGLIYPADSRVSFRLALIQYSVTRTHLANGLLTPVSPYISVMPLNCNFELQTDQ